ncbi:hypothetical protein [Treponema zioleckii]|uniref:hypothetical protein n=1 Tax=Treponema zioleckii TaxID=331680 RepID=UPI00168B19E1|nr:hypothetical protein [Treponema zioleckii]
MELNFKLTLQDSIDSAVIMRKLSNISKQNDRRRRIVYIFFLVVFLAFSIFAFRTRVIIGMIIPVIMVFVSCVNIIFADKLNVRSYKKAVLRNYKIISKQYNHNFLEPTNIKIKTENGFVEIESFEKIVKYPIQDYIKYFKEDRLHVFEFKNGKYIFINEKDLSDDMFEAFCKELENK